MIGHILYGETDARKKLKVIHVNEKTGDAVIQEQDTIGTTIGRVVRAGIWLGFLAAVVSSLDKKD